MKHTSFVYIVVVLVMVPITLASTCQHPGGAMATIRRVHSGIRQAFVEADEFVAPKFEAAGDACIAQSEAQSLTGQAAIDASNECMRVWLQLDQAISASREAMAELENVYNSIEAGTAGESDWIHWARQALAHGRSIMRFLVELAIDGADEIIASLSGALDQICEVADCEGGA